MCDKDNTHVHSRPHILSYQRKFTVVYKHKYEYFLSNVELTAKTKCLKHTHTNNPSHVTNTHWEQETQENIHHNSNMVLAYLG